MSTEKLTAPPKDSKVVETERVLRLTAGNDREDAAVYLYGHLQRWTIDNGKYDFALVGDQVFTVDFNEAAGRIKVCFVDKRFGYREAFGDDNKIDGFVLCRNIFRDEDANCYRAEHVADKASQLEKLEKLHPDAGALVKMLRATFEDVYSQADPERELYTPIVEHLIALSGFPAKVDV